MRLRPFVGGVGIVALALSLGGILSLATTRVVNWFVMTDELFYERLAISVAHTGSVLPRIHGEFVSNVNQLYPILISFVYGDADVPASLESAHRLNAFLFASAAIPVYLLARRVGIGPIVSLWAGALAVAVPWSVLASFLMTEVVAYPAFCWALLAVTHATIREDLGGGCARLRSARVRSGGADAVPGPRTCLPDRCGRRGAPDPRVDAIAGSVAARAPRRLRARGPGRSSRRR